MTIAQQKAHNITFINRSINVLLFTSLLVSSVSELFTDNVFVFFIFALPCIVVGLYKSFYDLKFSLYIILFLATEAMGLWPSISILGGTVSWGDIGIIYSLFLFIMLILKGYKYYIEKTGIIIIIYFLFNVLGSWVGYSIYGQSPIIGVLVFRKSYIYFGVIPIIMLLQHNKINKSDIVYAIKKFAVIYSIMCILQSFFLYMGFCITSYQVKIRWGYRLYATSQIWTCGLFILLYEIINYKLTLSKLFQALFLVSSLMFISQGRMELLGTAIGGLIIYFLSAKTVNKKKIFVIVILITFIALSIPSVREMILNSIHDINNNSEDSSMYYRYYERIYFDKLLEGNEFFGVGTPNMNFGLAMYYSGKNIEGVYNGHYLAGAFTSDLGTYSVKYHFGFLGLITFWSIISFTTIKLLNTVLVKKIKVIENMIFIGLLGFFFSTFNTLCGLLENPVQFVLLFIFGYLNSKNYNKWRVYERHNFSGR